MTASIVVDIGGTTTRIGVHRDGALLPGTVRFPTPKLGARDRHLDRIATEVDRLRASHPDRLRRVGVAIGATVDSGGVVRNASMLWHEPSTGFDLAAALRQRLDWATIEIANDIAAAAWRYRRLGRFALVTISTGVAVKVFDDALPIESKLVQDADGLGGEVGHVPVSSGPPAAQLPWCECGNTGDLCSYVGGPATVRATVRQATADPTGWRASTLATITAGDPERITAEAIATAANDGDAFTTAVLATATRPLALYLLQLSAQLGLRQVVVMGGFARGVGEPWFAALRSHLRELLPTGGWFTGWTASDVEALVSPSLDDDDSLIGMGRFLDCLGDRARELHKPIGASGVSLRGYDRPRCGREQFVAEISYAGICGTDLQILRGERGCEPGVLGHECVGRIVEVGADVTDPAVGSVFTVNPNHPYDEHDKLGHNLPGVFRQVAVWDSHFAARGQLIELPTAPTAAGVLVEPLACTVRSMRLAGEHDQWKGRRVLVIGAGVSGLLHVLLARRWGADQVLLANRGSGRLVTAIDRGVIDAVDCATLDDRLAGWVTARTGGAGADAVIMTTGGDTGPRTLATLWPCLAPGASVHLYGGFLPGAVIRTPDGQGLPAQPIRSRGVRQPVRLPGGGEAVLVGSRGADRDDFQAAIQASFTDAGGTLDLAPLISHVVSLDAAPAVLDELTVTGRLGGEPALRVVVDLSERGHSVRRMTAGDLPAWDGAR
ncbi:ROK family protein [Solwaraspora sp. WMMD406]|uniref:ROK family protein n=1 Tax=Solwaraspora sp. WMMD406 TaxID=3016095 RepID=UPI00241808C8|nr:ROK family protein [Solwaraspora sp. WMMD406]MDG4765744.1 ROK family protein [Solwaraspora sp. WMMD406]